MRDYLFRGKSKDDNCGGTNSTMNRTVNKGDWLYGDFSCREDGVVFVDCWTADPETVGQYTGLKDKDGVKIFEGDIVRYCEEPKVIAKIVFRRGCWMLDYSGNDEDYLYDFPAGVKVIGNVFDNPELLAEEK